MNGPRISQRLTARIRATACLVALGVCAVPATGAVRRAMADAGVISLSFGAVVAATVGARGHLPGNHVHPAVPPVPVPAGRSTRSDFSGHVTAPIAAVVTACRASGSGRSGAAVARR